MMESVLVCLFVLALVASNPVPQIFSNQQYASQQIPFVSSPSIPAAYQNYPYSQQVITQNHSPVQRNLDGSIINELLVSKILKNPCLQKILDPNTKLYNQNGQEIQRLPNTAAAPSVINNYFIVPPEFFNLNINETVKKSHNKQRKRKNGDKKAKLPPNEIELNVLNDKPNLKISTSVIKNNKPKVNSSNNTRKSKRRQNIKSAQIVQENNEMNLEQYTKEIDPEIKVYKKKRKHISKNNTESPVGPLTYGSNVEVSEKLDTISGYNNNDKRCKKLKNKPIVVEKHVTDNVQIAETGRKETSSESDNLKSESMPELESNNLKNIESPVDNIEAVNTLENNCDLKLVKENRKTRNPNTEKVKKESKDANKPDQSIGFISEDILRNFYPFMFSGNNFYSNGFYPFNLEQFYQPYINSNTKKNKSNKSKRIRNEQHKQESLPNIVEVKLKPKKHENNTTTKIFNEKDIVDDFLNITTTTEKVLERSNKNTVEKDYITEKVTRPTEEVQPQEVNDEQFSMLLKETKPDIELELVTYEQKSPVTKASLEMPPTVIEDLHDYITPELGSEDIVPTIHTNGIINDYYPIFYDDSPYIHDESYHLRDFDNDRHFYTTDRGFEEPLNRDRRKYDIYKDYPRSNLNIKDRINFRRAYKFRQRDKSNLTNDEKDNKNRPSFDKEMQMEDFRTNSNVEPVHVNQNDNNEDQFQTPPLLEKPDFITTKVEKVIPESDKGSYELREPVFIDFVEDIPDIKIYSDVRPIQYSRLINFDDDVDKNDKVTTKLQPKSDRIETVFAKTRVVKYGVAKDEEENTSSHPTHDKDAEKLHSDGQTTYVLAKSLSSNDYFW